MRSTVLGPHQEQPSAINLSTRNYVGQSHAYDFRTLLWMLFQAATADQRHGSTLVEGRRGTCRPRATAWGALSGGRGTQAFSSWRQVVIRHGLGVSIITLTCWSTLF